MTKVALVTGGQQGIGFGISRSLIDQGYWVAIAALPTKDELRVKSALDTLGSKACYFEFDVTDTDKVRGLVDDIEAQMGPITSLISNAGIPAKTRGDILDVSRPNFEAVLEVNLTGGFFLAQEVARRMVERTPDGQYQSIIFVTSVSAKLVSIERSEYCISKAAASMMSSLFAARLAPHDIGVFELRPGIIDTDMTQSVHAKYTDSISKGLVPAMRWGQPDDIGHAIIPMVEGELRFSTGTVINIDGGLSISRL